MSKNVKEAKEFNLDYNLPQVRSLEGDELFAEQEKFKMIGLNKPLVIYGNERKLTVKQIVKDLEEAEQVFIKLGQYYVIRVVKTVNSYIIQVNGQTIKSIVRDTDTNPNEHYAWTYVEKTGDYIAPDSVQATGVQKLEYELSKLLG